MEIPIHQETGDTLAKVHDDISTNPASSTIEAMVKELGI